MKILTKVGEFIRATFIAFFGGAIVLILLSAGGEFVDEYIFTKPLWVVWIAYLVTGGLAYLLVQATRNKLD